MRGGIATDLLSFIWTCWSMCTSVLDRITSRLRMSSSSRFKRSVSKVRVLQRSFIHEASSSEEYLSLNSRFRWFSVSRSFMFFNSSRNVCRWANNSRLSFYEGTTFFIVRRSWSIDTHLEISFEAFTDARFFFVQGFLFGFIERLELNSDDRVDRWDQRWCLTSFRKLWSSIWHFWRSSSRIFFISFSRNWSIWRKREIGVFSSSFLPAVWDSLAFVLRCSSGREVVSLRSKDCASRLNHRDDCCTSPRDCWAFRLEWRSARVLCDVIRDEILPRVDPAIEPAHRSFEVWVPLLWDEPGSHEAIEVSIDIKRLERPLLVLLDLWE